MFKKPSPSTMLIGRIFSHNYFAIVGVNIFFFPAVNRLVLEFKDDLILEI
jgi:hypothetical protein